jgi:hypothetical protein
MQDKRRDERSYLWECAFREDDQKTGLEEESAVSIKVNGKLDLAVQIRADLSASAVADDDQLPTNFGHYLVRRR